MVHHCPKCCDLTTVAAGTTTHYWSRGRYACLCLLRLLHLRRISNGDLGTVVIVNPYLPDHGQRVTIAKVRLWGGWCF